MSAQIRKRYGSSWILSAISLLGKPLSDASVTFTPAVLVLARERDDGLVGALALDQVVADRVEVLDGALDAAGDHHRPRLAADLVQREHLLVEVVHHDLGLEPDRVVVALDVAAQLLLRPLGVELGVALDRLDQPVVAVDRRVVLEHVEDEALLDRLLHRVAVERPVLDLPPPSANGSPKISSVLFLGVAVKAK